VARRERRLEAPADELETEYGVETLVAGAAVEDMTDGSYHRMTAVNPTACSSPPGRRYRTSGIPMAAS